MSEPAARPSITTLIDWLEGRLDEAESERIDRAVRDADAGVAATVQWLRGFLVTSSALPLQDAPPLVSQRLRQYYEKWARSRAIFDSAPDEREALLVFDSRQDLVGAGARGGDAGDAAHLAFTSDAADLLIDVRYLGAGRVSLEGQVLRARPTSARVFEATAEGPDLARRTIDGDELGRFAFGDLPETVSRLRASNGELSIVAPLHLARE